jgi:glycosyltransferase involved in cell wall biosynthesis
MRIVFIGGSILQYARHSRDVMGGAERQQWLLCQALARRGHAIVVYHNLPGEAPSAVVDGVRFRSYEGRKLPRALPGMLGDEHADWLYLRCADYYHGYSAVVARLQRTRVAYACAMDSDCHVLTALTRRRYLWPSYALGLALCDRILVQHIGQLRALPAILRRKALVVPSMVGPVTPCPERKRYVAWVAALREPKRPHLLVEIAQRLPEVEFVACGPSALHRTPRTYSTRVLDLLANQKNIEYRGAVSSDEAQTVIAQSTVLLSTSRLEGLPNTFLQAMGAGVPVVSLQLDAAGLISRSGGGALRSRWTNWCT